MSKTIELIFVICFALANGMLAEFQMRRNLPILEQGKAHSCTHCQNAFETAPGDNPQALDAGIVEHANWLTKSCVMTAPSLKPCHSLVPRLGAVKTKSARTTPGKPIETRSNWPSCCQRLINAATTASGVAGFGVLTRTGSVDSFPEALRTAALR